MRSYSSVLQFLSLVIAVQLAVHVQCACDKKKCTGPNEEYTECTESACRPITCDDVGNTNLTNCQDKPSKCTPACICKDGYARNKNGSCIEVKNCPSCGGDPNAVSGCGNHCEDNCSNLGKKPGSYACAAYCLVNGCDCRKGYYYNNDTKKCVKPSQCPATSCNGDPNAVPGCGNHCQDNCSNYGVDPSTYGCAAYCVEGGCDCKKGFYYNNKTKLCGTPAQCPKC